MLRVRARVSSFEELKEVNLAAYDFYKDERIDHAYEFLYKDVDYFVYGLLMTAKGLFVMTSEIEEDYMKITPLAMFDIVDYQIPKIWKMYSGNTFNGWDNVYWYYTFEEWSADPNFYEKLIEGDVEAVRLFEHVKKKYY